MIDEDKTISYIRQNGPVLPVQIAKDQRISILFASAHLADLSERKKVLISHIKIGGSPLYYLPGQESKLQDYAKNLNDKDKETLELLKEKKVLRDDKIDPLTRVSLRNIKDFAIAVPVMHNNQKYLFWKWYLLSNQEAQPLMEKLLEEDYVAKNQIEEQKRKEEEEKARIEAEKKRIEEEKKKFEEEVRNLVEMQKREIEKLKAEQQRIIDEEKKRIEQQLKEQKRKEMENKKREEKLRIESEKKMKEEEMLRIEEENKKIEEERKKIKKVIKQEPKKSETPEIKDEIQTPLSKPEDINDIFFLELKKYFDLKNIKINDVKIIRKNAEIDLLLSVPSAIGSITYYCKAKNKKSVTDADISSAFVQGQLKKMPAMLISKGELNKKAKELLNTEIGRNVLITKM